MPRPSRLLWLLPAAFLPAAFVFAACGTEPVSVEGCRSIEEVRCEASVYCPGNAVKDVAACKRFYRDQCLHGLAVAGDPGDPVVLQCVAAIRSARDCAASNACEPGQIPLTSPAGGTSCDIILHPERAVDCAFLAPAAPASTVPTLPGSGGAGGAAGAGGTETGGAAGAGGTEAGGAAGTAGASATAGAGGAG